MVDNLAVTPGTGASVAADLVGGNLMQQIKINLGATHTDGGLISATNGLPANIAQVGGSALAFGAAVSASSIPIVIASDQSALPAPIPAINTSSAYAHTASTTAYAYGQLWANNATAGSVTFGTVTVAKANNQACNIIGGILQKSGASTTNAIFRVHLFTAAPTTAVADRGAFQANLTLVNEIGYMDCSILNGGSDVSWGTLSPLYNSQISTFPVSGAQTLYFAIEVRAAYTPLSAETLTLTLDVA